MNKEYRKTALEGLEVKENSFSYAGENGIVRSKIKGIKRLMDLVDEDFDLSSGFVADRVVGKAAAMLMVLLGAKNVYAKTISTSAYDFLIKNGVSIECEATVPMIINRDKTGICPMESTVLDTDDINEAHRLLKNKMTEMKII